MEWLNTDKPLVISEDLKGKFVLLDFWTYCCINCIHILPELKKLEHEFPNELVVIGVHSAKFEAEKDTQNIAEAILRYEIEHPVVNDHEMEIWKQYHVSSWPTMYLIDPEHGPERRRRARQRALAQARTGAVRAVADARTRGQELALAAVAGYQASRTGSGDGGDIPPGPSR
jgi:thiol-disulfide isomerase/thioredoxin